jgi:hypothetical protein
MYNTNGVNVKIRLLYHELGVSCMPADYIEIEERFWDASNNLRTNFK